jgi:hypothetical protein
MVPTTRISHHRRSRKTEPPGTAGRPLHGTRLDVTARLLCDLCGLGDRVSRSSPTPENSSTTGQARRRGPLASPTRPDVRRRSRRDHLRVTRSRCAKRNAASSARAGRAHDAPPSTADAIHAGRLLTPTAGASNTSAVRLLRTGQALTGVGAAVLFPTTLAMVATAAGRPQRRSAAISDLIRQRSGSFG